MQSFELLLILFKYIYKEHLRGIRHLIAFYTIFVIHKIKLQNANNVDAWTLFERNYLITCVFHANQFRDRLFPFQLLGLSVADYDPVSCRVGATGRWSRASTGYLCGGVHRIQQTIGFTDKYRTGGGGIQLMSLLNIAAHKSLHATAAYPSLRCGNYQLCSVLLSHRTAKDIGLGTVHATLQCPCSAGRRFRNMVSH